MPPASHEMWFSDSVPVAFPAVSAGIYGWPAESAARIALTTVSRTPSGLEEARFVLFTADMLAAFRTVLDSLGI